MFYISWVTANFVLKFSHFRCHGNRGPSDANVNDTSKLLDLENFRFAATLRGSITVRHGSADTVVRAINYFNGKCYFLGSDSSETFLTDFQKILHSWLRPRHYPTCKCGVNRFKGRVSAHAWSCRRQASISFSFLFLFPWASLQVGPFDRSTPLTAQTTRPVGIHIPYMVWIIKINIFTIFYPKIWKIALRPTATSKTYNSGTFEDTCTLFAPNWGFSGSGNRMVSFKFTPDRSLLLWQSTTDIWTQNWR